MCALLLKRLWAGVSRAVSRQAWIEFRQCFPVPISAMVSPLQRMVDDYAKLEAEKVKIEGLMEKLLIKIRAQTGKPDFNPLVDRLGPVDVVVKEELGSISEGVGESPVGEVIAKHDAVSADPVLSDMASSPARGSASLKAKLSPLLTHHLELQNLCLVMPVFGMPVQPSCRL